MNEAQNALKTLRKRRDLSQQDLAVQLGLAWSTIARWENSRAPNAEALAALRRYAKEHGCDEEAAAFTQALAQALNMPEIERL